MKNQIINEIQRKMLPYLNNEQLLHLKAVLEASFQGVIIEMGEEQPKAEEQDSAAAFITAKRIEGCSEKTLTYYSKTIETSVYKGYKQDKIEMRGDRAEMSDFPLYLNMVAGGLDRRDQTIGGFSFVVKIYAVPVIEIIG